MKPNLAFAAAVVLITSAAVSACATAPAIIPIENSRSISLSKDEAWSNLVEYFATGNIAIKTIEKDSGIIYAERMFSHTAQISEFADCGSSALAAPTGGAVDLNVFVRETPAGVNTTVNARFRQTRTSFDGRMIVADCSSLGNLERRILDAAAGR